MNGLLNPSYSVRDGLLEMFGVTVDDLDVDNGSLCLLCYKCLLRAYVKYTTSMHDYHKPCKQPEPEGKIKETRKINTLSVTANVTNNMNEPSIDGDSTLSIQATGAVTSSEAATLQPKCNCSVRHLCFLCNNRFESSNKKLLKKPLKAVINPSYSVREGLLQIYGVPVDDADYDARFLCLPCYGSLVNACNKKMDEAFLGKDLTDWTGENRTLSIQQSEPLIPSEAVICGPLNDPENMPMANMLCFLCNQRFKEKRRGHGYLRTSLRGSIKPGLCTVKEGLVQVAGVIVDDAAYRKSFLCTPCYKDLARVCKRHFTQKKAKDSTLTSENVEAKPTKSQKMPKVQNIPSS